MLRDIGANLTGAQFNADLDAVLLRAKSAKIAFIDITGTDLKSSKAAAALAIKDPAFLGSSAGIHPHSAKHADMASLAEIAALLSRDEVLMCGEMGLDFDRNYSTPAEQIWAFNAQLDIAEQVGKPLFLHCRKAHAQFIQAMDAHPNLWQRAIVHCFTGSKNEAAAYLERGAHIGITGWIADARRNHDLLDAMTIIPPDRILLETDAPYLMPLNKPKSQARDRNEPSYLHWVAKGVADIKGMTIDEVAIITFSNAEKLIGRGLPSQAKLGTTNKP